MSGLPQAAEHATTYATEFMERQKNSQIVEIDGVQEEKSMLSKGEKAIIARLNCPVKFTRTGFVADTKIGVGVTAEKKKYVRRDKVVELDMLGSHEWELSAAMSQALYSVKESTAHLIDDEQKRRIVAKCSTMCADEYGDIFLAGVHERLSVPQDMRHMFMKMYLILQDYNLAVTSKSENIEVSLDIKYPLVENAAAIDRQAIVTAHSVVIDADGFTPEELGLLGLAGQCYPSVFYTQQNMYSKCNMAADDLVLISDGKIDIDTSLVWSSPDRLYQMIWDIAAKLNSVSSMISAFENMRGKCKMVADIVKKTGPKRINSMVPLSYNMECAFGCEYSRMSIKNHGGYFSSSMCLVSDLLYGMTFEAAATCVAESLGACGTLLSSKTPKTNPVINGILRDYGLHHTSGKDNILLANWDVMAGRPMTWDFGRILKDYLLELATMIANGADIVMPQILHAVPSLTAVNTAYGLARGWNGPDFVLDTDKAGRANDTDGLASFSWMMGVRSVRPMVFFNRSGKRPAEIGMDEYHLQAEADGEFGIGQVSFWIWDSLGGRIDENEQTASTLYRTEYAGTKCAMVYSTTDEKWSVVNQDFMPGRQSMKGEMPKEDPEPQVVPVEKPVGPKDDSILNKVTWGASRARKPEKIFEALASLARGNQIAPSAHPRHTRIMSDGSPAVLSRYIRDGEMDTSVLKSRRVDVAEGDEIAYSKLEVPGDGRCGIHALVENLKAHGMIAPGDISRVESLFSDETASKSFHDAQELAALAQKWGMSLDVIEKQTGNLYRYGPGGEGHTLAIVRDGLHFDAAYIGSGKEKMKVERVHLQENSPEEFVQQVAAYGNLFGNASI